MSHGTLLEVSPIADFTPRKSTRRDPWSEDEARAVLSAASRGDLSHSAFARRYSLSDRTLHWWNSRLHAPPDGKPATRSFVRVCAQSLPNRVRLGIEIAVAEALVGVAPGFCVQTLAQAHRERRQKAGKAAMAGLHAWLLEQKEQDLP